MKELLGRAKGRRYHGAAELAREAAEILSRTGLSQERGTVSELPDERTVRFYLTEGLLTPAEERQGTAAVYGYRQLLELLVVKRLQAEHLPIRKIRELIAGRTERQLERLLGDVGSGALRDEGAAAPNEAMRYLESLLARSQSPSASSSLPPPSPPSPSMPAARTSASPPLILGSAVLPSAAGPSEWRRIEIEPGLELHIRSDYQAPADARSLERLAQLIVKLLKGSEGGRPRAGKGR